MFPVRAVNKFHRNSAAMFRDRNVDLYRDKSRDKSAPLFLPNSAVPCHDNSVLRLPGNSVKVFQEELSHSGVLRFLVNLVNRFSVRCLRSNVSKYLDNSATLCPDNSARVSPDNSAAPLPQLLAIVVKFLANKSPSNVETFPANSAPPPPRPSAGLFNKRSVSQSASPCFGARNVQESPLPATVFLVLPSAVDHPLDHLTLVQVLQVILVPVLVSRQ